MAYEFLNTTTQSKPLQMQEQLIAQIMQQQQQQGFDFSDLEEIGGDDDLIEIMQQEELEEQQEQQDDSFSYEAEEEDDLSDSTDQLIASMLLGEREPDQTESMGSVGTYHTPATMPEVDTRRRDRKPRIWFPQEDEPGTQQYGGYAKKPKYQFGGTLMANTEEEQTRGLNDPSYNNAILNLEGVNTIRGLDNYQPIAVTDGRKYKILNGPKDTAKFRGKVYEQKL